jgi:hypothetical protein
VKKPSKLQTRVCPCGKTFEAWPSQPRKHCNQACAHNHHGRRLGLKPKICLACGVTYQPTSAGQKWCEECSPGDKSIRTRLRRYGITSKQWSALQAKHDGVCWICRERPADTVDHDHETNEIRGALCRVCNMVLHYVERPGWWDAAQAYLRG